MRWPMVTAAALLVVQVAQASSAPNWPASLARFLSASDVLTSTNLAGALAPAIRLDAAGCQTARLPGAASEAPVSASVVAYEDDQACNRPTRLVLLTVSLDAEPGLLGAFGDALHNAFPAPCFAGDLTPEKRRHAPVRHLEAWRLPGRIVTIGTQAGDPDSVSVALLQTGPTAPSGAATAAAQLAQDFRDGLPAGCK